MTVKKPRWLRFFYQFSLRTLLIVTTLAAIGCGWFWGPKSHEEQLAGKLLTLRRQVRVEPGKNVTRQWPFTARTEWSILTNVGSWRLADQHGDLVASGRFQHGLPSGKWTTYHTSGRQAATGQVVRRARSGLWRTWDADGTLRSEVAYRPTDQRTLVPPAEQLWWETYAPGMNTPTVNRSLDAGYRSVRHGPARNWFASGSLEFDGAYADDLRHGSWTTYDAAGRIVEQGEYRRDQRKGKWLVRKPSVTEGVRYSLSTVEYIGGRTKAEHERLLTKVAQELGSGDLRRQLAVGTSVDALGAAAAPILLNMLREGSYEAQLLALRHLLRQDSPPTQLLAQIEPLVHSHDPRLALRAMYGVYLLAPTAGPRSSRQFWRPSTILIAQR